MNSTFSNILLSLTAILSLLCPMILSLKVQHYTLEDKCCNPCKRQKLQDFSPIIKLFPRHYEPHGHFTKAYFAFYKVKKTWREANAICMADGGHLAFPRTQEEFKSLRFTLKKIKKQTNTQFRYIHAGFYKKGGKRWISIRGHPVKNYIPMEWEKKRCPGSNVNDKMCGGVSFQLKMTEVTCDNEKLYFICEIRAIR